jgi:hypothetical protein
MTATDQHVGTDADPYYAGDSLELTFDVDQPDGTAKDLTGATVSWAVASRPGDTPALDDGDAGVTLTISDAANGEVTVTVDAGATSDLSGLYYHELEVEDASGAVDTVARGEFTVTPDVIA